MDFTQRKLSKPEWESIEVPVSEREKSILKLIKDGFHNIDLKYNYNNTILSYAKLERSDVMEKHIFNLYLKKRLEKIYKKSGIDRKINISVKISPKKKELIRLDNIKDTIDNNKDILYEFTVLELIEKMLTNVVKKRDKWMYYYYTLTHLIKIHLKMNIILEQEVKTLLDQFHNEVNHIALLENCKDTMEKNSYLLRYSDVELYEHQKRIFSLFKNNTPKLVLYVAPTGTGKTLTPIGLSESNRVIFLCAARHVGLALAKAAISAGRKIALAFNCNDSDDVRLHFAAAKEYTRNYRTGGIFRVDNSVGDNVEMIISDIQSYSIAMRYMSAFNPKDKIITYWDEPTITMDYESHPFHELIQQNWRENIIPNIVLSSATLPKEEDIREVIGDYKAKFDGEVISIISADCNNSIPLISKEGHITLPHHLPENEDYQKMLECVSHCVNSSSLIRYMDLAEICKFILYVNSNSELLTQHRYKIETYFETVDDIKIKTIKNYYLQILPKIYPPHWSKVYTHFKQHRTTPFTSNIYVTTKDAYTLTHGPSIYLAKDVEKVARFYLQQSNIPVEVIKMIQDKVCKNDKMNDEIAKLERTYENAMQKDAAKEKKMGNEDRVPPEMKQLRRKIENLQLHISSVSMPELYVPNTKEHLYKWCKDEDNTSVFIPEISDEYVIKLMQLNDVEPMWKLLLLMGIGVFMDHTSVGYVEIMKSLAQEQKLLLILATDDYIYGTNYQFCHGYISKDLVHLTQEKLIQAIGRVGRNKQNKDYSVRMRDNSFLSKIFTPLDIKKEAIMMNKLFNSD